MSKLHNITKQQDNEATIRPGQVKLVGFGPGDPDLLTVKAVKAIEAADIIFYDDLISKDYLEQIDAEKVYVGKRSGHHSVEQRDINQLLLQAAKAGKEVVRLKGGDPMLFALWYNRKCYSWYHHRQCDGFQSQGESYPPPVII